MDELGRRVAKRQRCRLGRRGRGRSEFTYLTLYVFLTKVRHIHLTRRMTTGKAGETTRGSDSKKSSEARVVGGTRPQPTVTMQVVEGEGEGQSHGVLGVNKHSRPTMVAAAAGVKNPPGLHGALSPSRHGEQSRPKAIGVRKTKAHGALLLAQAPVAGGLTGTGAVAPVAGGQHPSSRPLARAGAQRHLKARQ